MSIMLSTTVFFLMVEMHRPMSMAGAVSYRPQIAGTSSGLSSAIGLSLSGVFTIVAGSVYDGDFVNIAIMMAVVATLTAMAGLLTRPSAD